MAVRKTYLQGLGVFMKNHNFSLFTVLKRVFSYLLTPKSQEGDLQRRTFILNVLLVGTMILSFCSFVSALIGKYFFSLDKAYQGVPPFILLVLFLIFFLLYIGSRMGKPRATASILLTLYYVGATYTAYRWGVDVPQSILIYALVIVMSGILIGSKFAFFMTGIIGFTLSSIGYAQQEKFILVNSLWKSKPADLRDSFITIITLFIIAVVSWLSNREMEKALKRAQSSERDLKRERDQLEITIEKRTQELRESQVEKVAQLYRFAEVGRLTAGFFHDLATPISLISLNLHTLNNKNQQKELATINVLLKRAMNGTRYLENFVASARKQLQNHEIKKTFSLNKEIKQVIQLLHYKTNETKIKILFETDGPVKLFGNPIKFNQILMNLLLNAFDASKNIAIAEKDRVITVRLIADEKNISLSVHNWGVRINKEDLRKIFDPFFTTKNSDYGTGLGLSITRDIIQKNFHGKITVSSDQAKGTTFTIIFPHMSPKIKQL